MAELIQKTDTLNEGREKLNEAIKDAEKAKEDSSEAIDTANTALSKSDSTQTQLDNIVVDGDSSVEAAQARVDEKGQSHTTLKERIDDGFTKVNTQLAETEQEVEGVFMVLNDTVLAMDLQGIDTNSLEKRGEILPVRGTKAEERVILSEKELRDTSHNTIEISDSILRKYKEIDYIVGNSLDTDVRLSFSFTGSDSTPLETGAISIYLEDGTTRRYNNSTNGVSHVIPAGARNINLSSIPATTNDGSNVKAQDLSPFKKIHPFNAINLSYRAITQPTEGVFSVALVGVPY